MRKMKQPNFLQKIASTFEELQAAILKQGVIISQ